MLRSITRELAIRGNTAQQSGCCSSSSHCLPSVSSSWRRVTSLGATLGTLIVSSLERITTIRRMTIHASQKDLYPPEGSLSTSRTTVSSNSRINTSSCRRVTTSSDSNLCRKGIKRPLWTCYTLYVQQNLHLPSQITTAPAIIFLISQDFTQNAALALHSPGFGPCPGPDLLRCSSPC